MNADDLLKSVQRDINCLGDNSKMTRKRALIKLKTMTVDAKVKPEVLQILLAALLKPLIRLFADPTEKARELSIELVTEISKTVTTVIPMLPYVVSAIVTRIGAADVEEESEEVRLLLVTLLSVLVTEGKKAIALYMDEFILVLVKGVVDPCPAVKKACCDCIVILAETIPERFHMGSKPLHKPLIATLGHNHSKVPPLSSSSSSSFRSSPFSSPTHVSTFSHTHTLDALLFCWLCGCRRAMAEPDACALGIPSLLANAGRTADFAF